MLTLPVIAVFDIGKTNKKLLLFDEHYRMVYEKKVVLTEIQDEDGYPCEDLMALAEWIKDSVDILVEDKRFNIKAFNFSGYGASFVYVDKNGKVIAPLYNYLKPYPGYLKRKFYDTYGGEKLIAQETASPVLGSLNSGMQLYRLKNERPDLFEKIAFAFHLPQYLSYLLTDYPAADITAIGCHTNLWDFAKNTYHNWVIEEGIEDSFASIRSCYDVVNFVYRKKNYISGFGLHDSSAALIPYLATFKEPFILLSTGTWCISLNPFNHSQLTYEELQHDCLCYLTYEGKKVKASRIFTGYEHEQKVKKLAIEFNKPDDYYMLVNFNFYSFEKILLHNKSDVAKDFETYEEAYHDFIIEIVSQQVRSTNLVLQNSGVNKIYVDGGFSSNNVFMNILARAFTGIDIFAAELPQASALGAAMAIHKNWNSQPLPTDIIKLVRYPGK